VVPRPSSSSDSTSDRASRAELRRTLRRHRRALAEQRPLAEDAEALAVHVLALVEQLGLRPGATITSYDSVRWEPPTRALNAVLTARGFRVLLPITEPDFDLDWYDAMDAQASPLGRDAIAGADLVLAPGLAVDSSGTRMGQGGGCYDRALPRRRPGVPVVVLLHPGELRPAEDAALPSAAHDVPVDAVLCADGTVTVRARG
jgi:5-formyltetrahydrofolate cyclo-ligase